MHLHTNTCTRSFLAPAQRSCCFRRPFAMSTSVGCLSHMKGRYLVEGQIAAGKTSFLAKIAERPASLQGLDIRVIREPTKVWCQSPMGTF